MDKITEVVKIYNATGSLRETAKEAEMSAAKVRKILITAWFFKSERTQKIQKMYAAGASIADIADTLKIKESAVNNYLPYTKCIYSSDNPTENALRIRARREKKSI